MSGSATLAELYLGAEPTGVTVEGDRLTLHLADGRSILLPLEIISQLDTPAIQSDEARVVIVSHPPRIDSVRVTNDALVVYLRDGRILSSPLHWFPRLYYADSIERSQYQLVGDDDVIHWPTLDEDIELVRLFSGGASRESERSVQAWLAAHQHEAMAVNESPEEYTPGDEG